MTRLLNQSTANGNKGPTTASNHSLLANHDLTAASNQSLLSNQSDKMKADNNNDENGDVGVDGERRQTTKPSHSPTEEISGFLSEIIGKVEEKVLCQSDKSDMTRPRLRPCSSSDSSYFITCKSIYTLIVWL